MTEREYALSVAATRALPGWSVYGAKGCTDCETMTHCEIHHKSEGVYPDDAQMPSPAEEKP